MRIYCLACITSIYTATATVKCQSPNGESRSNFEQHLLSVVSAFWCVCMCYVCVMPITMYCRRNNGRGTTQYKTATNCLILRAHRNITGPDTRREIYIYTIDKQTHKLGLKCLLSWPGQHIYELVLSSVQHRRPRAQYT